MDTPTVEPNDDEAVGSFVYVLSNEAMPELVKIGVTSADDPKTRVDQLYGTGVPLPFTVEFAGRVADASEVERALHTAFRDKRINPKREFFRVDPDQVIKILLLLHPEDITGEILQLVSQSTSIEERRAAEVARKRKPNLNFEEMKIPVGAKLYFQEDASQSCEVIDARKVIFENEEQFLSNATKTILGIERSIRPTGYWTYNGVSLQEIYNNTYGWDDL